MQHKFAKKMSPLATFFRNYGGERGIRTLAPLTQSNPLAEGPLEPLGYLSKVPGLYPENWMRNRVYQTSA